jgi:hypothetical protein
MTSAGCPPPSYLSLEENEDVTIIVHLTRMYGEVLLIAPVSVLLAFKVVKEIAIGVGGGADRVIHKITFCVMVEKNPVLISSLATLSLFDPKKSNFLFLGNNQIVIVR